MRFFSATCHINIRLRIILVSEAEEPTICITCQIYLINNLISAKQSAHEPEYRRGDQSGLAIIILFHICKLYNCCHGIFCILTFPFSRYILYFVTAKKSAVIYQSTVIYTEFFCLGTKFHKKIWIYIRNNTLNN